MVLKCNAAPQVEFSYRRGIAANPSSLGHSLSTRVCISAVSEVIQFRKAISLSKVAHSAAVGAP